jgi:hypothetical protein
VHLLGSPPGEISRSWLQKNHLQVQIPLDGFGAVVEASFLLRIEYRCTPRQRACERLFRIEGFRTSRNAFSDRTALL